MTVAPLDPGDMFLFLIGSVFLVFGMSIFTMGADMSMLPLGNKIGSQLASSGRIWILALISFVIGIFITISEPDLQILARQVSSIENFILIITVSIGVGIFLTIALLRIVFGVSLQVILMIFYAVALVLAFILPEGFRPLAFDSGGVTTGPMTVPFIMSLGAGVSASRAKKEEGADAFGITALCSIGPIIAVMVLGIVSKINDIPYEYSAPTGILDTKDGFFRYATDFVYYVEEVALALLPIVVFTVLFQLVFRSFSKNQLIRVGVGLLYTFVGLAIFLTGANVGFMPTGNTIGISLAKINGGIWLIPIGMILGYFIVKAEPAVYVLNHQVEEMSAGAVSGKTTGLGLSVGVAAAIGLSALRIVTNIPIMYILVPGYVIAFILTFLVPKVFVGIAFDSGGVASGTMMSGFVLPLCVGACYSLNGEAYVMTDAFGCVAFVAMAPIIAIQVCGLLYSIKTKRRKRSFVSKEESFVEYPRHKARVSHKKETAKVGEEQA
ncbi:MAG: DUF1538 domain-containing protein [Clostridia bacterium]|nr:DUF1538 domain-containing protein [Clostridia bacterium]